MAAENGSPAEAPAAVSEEEKALAEAAKCKGNEAFKSALDDFVERGRMEASRQPTDPYSLALFGVRRSPLSRSIGGVHRGD